MPYYPCYDTSPNRALWIWYFGGGGEGIGAEGVRRVPPRGVEVPVRGLNTVDVSQVSLFLYSTIPTYLSSPEHNQ